MKIRVIDARALAEALTRGADEAMLQGQYEFDLTTTVKAIDDAAREELQKAIEAARAAGA